MQQRVKITVEVPDRRNLGSFKVIFCHERMIDDCVGFDFKSVYHGLRCIFDDSSAVISFMMMP